MRRWFPLAALFLAMTGAVFAEDASLTRLDVAISATSGTAAMKTRDASTCKANDARATMPAQAAINA